MTYQIFNKTTGKWSDPQGMGIKPGQCGCTPETQDPQCRNRLAYVIDWIDDKPVTLKECPRRFDDSELWECLHWALYQLKDMDKSVSFYGIPVSHLTEPVYQILTVCFAARVRYQAQREYMER